MLNLSNCKPFLDAPYPYTDLQEACIRDLETTQEEQARHRLETPNVGFCCLGRFCVVAKAERTVIDNLVSYQYKNDDAVHLLPTPLAVELLVECGGMFRQIARIERVKEGIRGGRTFNSLATMNDSGLYTFKDIAQYIRHDPWNVFRETPLPKGIA